MINFISWTPTYIASQVFAVLAAVVLAMSYFSKRKTGILICNLVCTTFFLMQYLLLGGYSAVAVNAISLFMTVWYYINERLGRHKDFVSLIVCEAMIVACGIVTFKVWYDIIPLVAGALFTFWAWQPKVSVYRWGGLVNSAMWISYNFLCMTIMGIILEIVGFVAKIVSVISWSLKKSCQDKSFEIVKKVCFEKF